MSNAPPSTDSALIDAAEILQQQLVYNGEVLDIALESLRSYKEGTQSLTYLDSSVNLSYALLRMLERWGKRKGDEVYVRRKKALKRRKKQGERQSVFPCGLFVWLGKTLIIYQA
jgi:replication fork protection complex subunit Tof1/Swi1